MRVVSILVLSAATYASSALQRLENAMTEEERELLISWGNAEDRDDAQITLLTLLTQRPQANVEEIREFISSRVPDFCETDKQLVERRQAAIGVCVQPLWFHEALSRMSPSYLAAMNDDALRILEAARPVPPPKMYATREQLRAIANEWNRICIRPLLAWEGDMAPPCRPRTHQGRPTPWVSLSLEQVKVYAAEKLVAALQ
jgi:hypothetical protein